jgi:hypothetical protein
VDWEEWSPCRKDNAEGWDYDSGVLRRRVLLTELKFRKCAPGLKLFAFFGTDSVA